MLDFLFISTASVKPQYQRKNPGGGLDIIMDVFIIYLYSESLINNTRKEMFYQIYSADS
jgi:hypothetical protein